MALKGTKNVCGYKFANQSFIKQLWKSKDLFQFGWYNLKIKIILKKKLFVKKNYNSKVNFLFVEHIFFKVNLTF